MTQLAWNEVVPGVWVAVAEPDAVNLTVVAAGDDSSGPLLVDTGSSPAQGALVRADVVELTGRDPALVVITHAHRDHWFGLAAFDDLASVGHAGLADSAGTPQVTTDLAELSLTPADLRAPTRAIHLALGVDLGGRRVEVVHLGPGHTRADLVVVLPQDKVVIAGDLVESADLPQIGEDTDLMAWPTTLDGLVGVLGADSVVIPGHGGLMDRTEVLRQRAELSAITGEVRALIERGVGQDQALEQGNWPWPEAAMTGPIAHGYAELEALGVRPRTQLPVEIRSLDQR